MTQTFIILYYGPAADRGEAPLSFTTQAESVNHAWKQVLDAHPDADIVHIYIGNSIIDALIDYLHHGSYMDAWIDHLTTLDPDPVDLGDDDPSLWNPATTIP